MDWLTDNKIPVGRTAAAGFDWLQANAAGVFDALSIGLEALIEAVLRPAPCSLFCRLFRYRTKRVALWAVIFSTEWIPQRSR